MELWMSRLLPLAQVAPAMIQEAIRRTDRLAPSQAPPEISIAKQIAPPPAEVEPRGVRLNKNETLVVHCLQEHRIVLVSELATLADLPPMTIDRSRRNLETVHGFIETKRVKTGQGRGKTGIAVYLPLRGTSGWAPPHRMACARAAAFNTSIGRSK